MNINHKLILAMDPKAVNQNVPINSSQPNPAPAPEIKKYDYPFELKLWDIFEYLLLFVVIYFLASSIQSSIGFLLDRTPDYSLGSEIIELPEIFDLLQFPVGILMFFWFYFGQLILYPFAGEDLYPTYGGDGPVWLRRENIFFFFALFSILYIHIKKRCRDNPEIKKSKLRILIAVAALIYSSLLMLEGLVSTFIASSQGLDNSIVLTHLSSAVAFGFVSTFYIVEILELRFRNFIYILTLGIFICFLIITWNGLNSNSKNISNESSNKSQRAIDPPGNLFSDNKSVKVLTLNRKFYSEKTKSNVLLTSAYLSPVVEGERNDYEDLYLILKFETEKDKNLDTFNLFKIKLSNGALYDAYSGGESTSPDNLITHNDSLFTISYTDTRLNMVFTDASKPEEFTLDFSKAETVKGTISDNGELVYD